MTIKHSDLVVGPVGRGREIRRREITKAWHLSTDGKAFIAALEKAQYILAYDRESYVVVDCSGGTHSLMRQVIGVKPKEVRAKLKEISQQLPDLTTAQHYARQLRIERVASDKSHRENLRRSILPFALLIIAVFLAYANVYHSEFLYDDIPMVRDNRFLTSWNYIGTLFVTSVQQGYGSVDPLYRPLQLLLYLVIYQVAGPSTVAFHLLNVTLHALNACLLYSLGVRLRFHRVVVMLAALLWAVHPIHTEAVTYVSGTADILSGVFLIGGILLLVPAFSLRRVLAASCLFVLGLLSKETSIVFPVLAMSVLFYLSENRWSPKTYLSTWPFWVVAILYLLARITILKFGGVFGFYDSGAPETIWSRVCTFLATLPTYLRLLIWPTGLHMERNFPFQTGLWAPSEIAGIVIVALLSVGLAWRPARSATPMAWGILWAGTLFIPVSGILVPNDAVIAEHWLYLPTSGFILGMAESLAQMCAPVRVRRLRSALTGFTILIACFFIALTFKQNEFWRDRITFYTHILDCGENTRRIRTNLAGAYEEQGKHKLAIDQFRSLLKVWDTYAIAHYDLGATLLDDVQAAPTLPDRNSPELAESVKELQRALELDPDYFRAYDLLDYIYGFYFGDEAQALEYRAKATAIRKKYGIE